jgi:cytochrome c oxidase subunit IV
MTETTEGNPYRIYRVTWVILLAITVAMLLAEKFHFPRWFLVLFLLAFMAVKAAMIGGNFMHLRYEHRRIPIMVACGIVLTSLVLLAFIGPESKSVRAKTTAPPPSVAAAVHEVHE